MHHQTEGNDLPFQEQDQVEITNVPCAIRTGLHYVLEESHFLMVMNSNALGSSDIETAQGGKKFRDPFFDSSHYNIIT